MADRLEESVEIIRRDRDRSRDFLADVSHELRTPIAALRTFNELLKDQAGADPARAGRVPRVEPASRSSGSTGSPRTCSSCRSSIPGSSCSTCGRTTCAPRSSRPSSRPTPAARRRGVDLDAAPAATRRSGSATTRSGSARSSTNLVGNAIKFTPPRRLGRRRASRRTRDGARIDVTDTGVGIDASELPHIFERFYRGSRANEARGSGSGLGLAIVRSIVDMHGGTVTVESRLGGGSRFTVILPRDPRTWRGRPAAERRPTARPLRPRLPTESRRDDRRAASPIEPPGAEAEIAQV